MPPVLANIVGWLRAGYPEGVPERDYVPLFALLASQLTDAEVAEVATALTEASADPNSAQAIRAAITEVTQTDANGADEARVRARLAAGGWPLASPDRLRSVE